ncbi:MAG TPA: hypothetical protein VMT46_18915, partial [Anaerolineaceae bacterium]|nr:hypothetical protein [Anaerolineaceae bacterium]
MEPSAKPQIDFNRPITRPILLLLLRSGFKWKEYRFVRQAAITWLASFPGDLMVGFYLAQVMVQESRVDQALSVLEGLVDRDPEFYAVQEVLSSQKAFGAEKILLAKASLAALGGAVSDETALPEWSRLTRQARSLFQHKEVAEAEKLLHQALSLNPASPLPAILHLQITSAGNDVLAIQNLANLYHTRWPNCLQFSLYLADARLRLGDEAGSVALLHQCVAFDAAAQVAFRIWGGENPYKPLWPEKMESFLNQAVPATVAREMGWNQLPEGEIQDYPESGANGRSSAAPDAAEPGTPEIVQAATSEEKAFDPAAIAAAIFPPETLRAIQDEFERIARRLHQPDVARSDGRFPIYVILSTRTGLEKQYGPQTAGCIDEEMQKLAEVIRRRPNWGAAVFYPDDPACMASFGVKPASANDPWKLKLALADLDTALAKKGEMIGALLIVGGPSIVPFHHLPNPTDDSDADVPSDNPYGTIDENYFITEWLVGRLPGDNGEDAGLILGSLRKMIAYHTKHTRPVPWWRRNQFLRHSVKIARRILAGSKAIQKGRPSFGYTASVWKQASQVVFKPIGDTQAMLVCPPSRTGRVLEYGLLPAQLTYFNLHGLVDAPEWYGQKDTSDPQDGPDYPIALTPADLDAFKQAPRLVFTEACYGANIIGKTEDQSLALKFLASGTLAVIGSTCISYGSVTAPLIAADFLGSVFWKQLRSGQT